MTRRLTLLAVLAGLGLLIVTFVGAGQFQPPKGDAPPPAAATPPATMTLLGTVDVESQVELLSPQLPNEIVEVVAGEGQAVKKGDVLIRLDDRQYRAKLAQAEGGARQAGAKLAQAKQALEMFKFGVKEQEAAVESEKALLAVESSKLEAERAKLVAAQSNLARVENLQRSKIAGQDEVNAARAGVEAQTAAIAAQAAGVTAREAGLKAAERKLERLRASEPTNVVTEAEGAVQTALGTLAEAKYALDLCQVKAPSDGVVLRLFARRGMSFGPQSKQPAVWFRPAGSALIVRVEVDQENARRAKVGQRVEVRDDTQADGRVWTGRVKSIAESYLPKRATSSLPEPFMLNETRVLEAAVAIDKPADGVEPLIGQRTRVKFLPDGQ